MMQLHTTTNLEKMATPPRDLAELADRGLALRAVVLLSGQVRSTDLTQKLRRNVLDLPIDQDLTVLDLWQQEAALLAKALAGDELPLRVMVNRQGLRPTARGERPGVVVSVETDADDYRGTGGVLRDVAQEYGPDDYVLVVNGGQVPVQPLAAMAAALVRAGGDVRLLVSDDGTPTGVMLVRCGAVRSLPAVGFLDMKEQALPRIAADHKVTVVVSNRIVALPIRTRADYLRALFWHHRSLKAQRGGDEPFAERWQCTFSVVEKGAEVEQGARVHDSVVLAGARLEAGATLVHSVACSEGVVAANKTVIDEVVGLNGNGNGNGSKGAR
jgi:hypothetical protein